MNFAQIFFQLGNVFKYTKLDMVKVHKKHDNICTESEENT